MHSHPQDTAQKVIITALQGLFIVSLWDLQSLSPAPKALDTGLCLGGKARILEGQVYR